MIDLATHYCHGGWIKNKIPCEIIRVFVERWLGIFGAPQRVLSNNGLEFQNNEMKKLAERFQIEMLSTAAESPWSNGVCERMIGMIREGLWKVIGEEDM